jgi:hypothetical protein
MHGPLNVKLFACALDELSVQESDEPRALASLSSQRRPLCPLNRSPGELQKRFYTFWESDEEVHVSFAWTPSPSCSHCTD